MYTTDMDFQIMAYPDLWRQNRYRIELTVKPYNSRNAGDVLQQLGYDVVDADQWGISYCHNENPDWTAEIYESPDGSEGAVLCWGNLNRSDVYYLQNKMDGGCRGTYPICQDGFAGDYHRLLRLADDI